MGFNLLDDGDTEWRPRSFLTIWDPAPPSRPRRLYIPGGGGSKTAFWTPCVDHVGMGSTGVNGRRLKTAILDHHLKIFYNNLNH